MHSPGIDDRERGQKEKPLTTGRSLPLFFSSVFILFLPVLLLIRDFVVLIGRQTSAKRICGSLQRFGSKLVVPTRYEVPRTGGLASVQAPDWKDDRASDRCHPA